MLWMQPFPPPQGPYIVVFRNHFSVDSDGELQLTFSGDERCRIFLDGIFCADGPECSTPQRWKQAHCTLPLTPGRHVLTAEVLCFGDTLPVLCQFSVRHGFYCRDNGILSPEWRCKVVPKCYFRPADPQYGTTLRLVCEAEDYDNCLNGLGDHWQNVVYVEDYRLLQNCELPPMRREPTSDFFRRGNVFVFRDYVCVWSEIEFSGRGMAELRWVEQGCDEDVFEEKYPAELAPKLAQGRPDILDIYPPGGGVTRYRPFCWDAGRTLEIRTTGKLQVRKATFFRTGYPLPAVSFEAFDPFRRRLLEKSLRTLQSCIGETYMDCPYYERKQYIGDSRIQALALDAIGGNPALTEKALRDFADGQFADGTMRCGYPLKAITLDFQPDGRRNFGVIPGFEAIYIQMLHDYALSRRNDELVKSLLPVIRKQISRFKSHLNSQGIPQLPGWNFLDWLSEYDWQNGCPPHGENGTGATLSWLIVLSLENAADLEHGLGDPAIASENLALARNLKQSVRTVFWDREHGCYAEDREHTVFSEHANAIAMLAEPHNELKNVMQSGSLIPAGIYFSFYVLEACSLYGMTELFRAREKSYLELANSPLHTIPEVFLDNPWVRSYCHAWSAHFLYHYFKKNTFNRKIFL